MMVLASILIACFIGGIFSVLLAGLLSTTVLAKHAHRMVAFAVGVLLGFAFTDLLPEALHWGIPIAEAGWILIGGMLLFFMLEKLAIWRHHHHFPHQNQVSTQQHAAQQRNSAEVTIILVGDGVHNFVDGILLAATFMTDVSLGWITALAITAHEIPQEISDFMVLMHAGLSKTRAILLNMFSGAAMLLGGLVGWAAFTQISHLIPHALLLAAASFIYIALADLVPTLHKQFQPKDMCLQSGLLILGLVVAWVSPLLQQFLIQSWKA